MNTTRTNAGEIKLVFIVEDAETCKFKKKKLLLNTALKKKSIKFYRTSLGLANMKDSLIKVTALMY